MDIKHAHNAVILKKRKIRQKNSSKKILRTIQFPIWKIKKIKINRNRNNNINLESITIITNDELETTRNEKEDKNKIDEEIKKIIKNYKNWNCEELNDLDYEIAVVVDKRNFWQFIMMY